MRRSNRLTAIVQGGLAQSRPRGRHNSRALLVRLGRPADSSWVGRRDSADGPAGEGEPAGPSAGAEGSILGADVPGMVTFGRPCARRTPSASPTSRRTSIVFARRRRQMACQRAALHPHAVRVQEMCQGLLRRRKLVLQRGQDRPKARFLFQGSDRCWSSSSLSRMAEGRAGFRRSMHP